MAMWGRLSGLHRMNRMTEMEYEVEEMLLTLLSLAGHSNPEQLLYEADQGPVREEAASGGSSDANSSGTPAVSSEGESRPTSGPSASASENATVSTSPMEDGTVPQSPTDCAVNTTLASHLADTSVTTASSGSATPMLVTSSSSSEPLDTASVIPSGQPSMIVSDIPNSGTSDRPSAAPQVIVQDIVELGNGMSVVLPSDSRTSGKRKAGDKEDTPEQAPSPKEPRRKEEEEEGEAAGAGGNDREPVDEGKEEALHQIRKLANSYRTQPITTAIEEQFRLLPREILQRMCGRLRIIEQEINRYRYGRYHNQNQRRVNYVYGEASDEDSDRESMMREALNPRPATFTISNQQKLQRILIFGDVTRARVGNTSPSTISCLPTLINTMITDEDGEQVVNTLKDLSLSGRSCQQDTVMYILALCCRSTDKKTKHAAYAAVQDVCRIPTHIFQLISFIEEHGDTSGWGRGLRKALCTWYNSRAANPSYLAMHVSKYSNRQGWNHRDVFRLSHIKPVNDAIGFIVRYVVKGLKEAEEEYLEDGYLGRVDLEKVHKYLKAVEEVKNCQEVDRTVQLVREYDLVREHLNSNMLNKPEVWAVLLPKMPLTALLRNLNKMTAVGLFSDADMVNTVVSKVLNNAALKKARVHPLKILLAHHMYNKGSGDKGHLQWTAVYEIVEALEKAFYASFQNVEPTNKRILVALDVSGSMGSQMPNCPLTVREASTVMAMVTIRREPHCDVVGFTSRLVPLEIFKDTSKNLQQLVQETENLPFGATDCSKPMTWARKHKKAYDAFIIYTDSETNSHSIPPFAALQKYRDTMHLPTAKLIVVGMTSSSVSVADPSDLHMLDLVGFDPDSPEIIREFLTGGVE